jgi:hypothetical protein
VLLFHMLHVVATVMTVGIKRITGKLAKLTRKITRKTTRTATRRIVNIEIALIKNKTIKIPTGREMNMTTWTTTALAEYLGSGSPDLHWPSQVSVSENSGRLGVIPHFGLHAAVLVSGPHCRILQAVKCMCQDQQTK